MITPKVKNLLYLLVFALVASGITYVILDKTSTFSKEEDVKSSENTAAQRSQAEVDAQYYAELEKQCGGRQEEQQCCLNAVSVMKKNGYKAAVGGKCGEGEELDGLDCIGNKPWCKPMPQGNKAGWNSYTSPTKYGFAIKYPDDFGFNTDISKIAALGYIPVCGEATVGCIFYSGGKYKGTNFESAGVSVNILKDADTEAKCYDFKVSTNEAQNQVGDVNINGIMFKSAVGGGGAAGHFMRTQVYRNFHNNTCYEIAQKLGSTNIGNYPEGTVKEFNENEIWSGLRQIVSTFDFAQQSQAKANGQKIFIGTTVCLPHKNAQPGQPQTLECAIGLKEEGTGKNYALKDFQQFIDTNQKVQVMGKLVADPDSNYDIVGAIEVANIKVVK